MVYPNSFAPGGESPCFDDRIHGEAASSCCGQLLAEHSSIQQIRCGMSARPPGNPTDRNNRNPGEINLQFFYRVEILMNSFFALSEFPIFGGCALTMQNSLIRQITAHRLRSVSIGLLLCGEPGLFFRPLFSSVGENHVCFFFSHYSAETFSS